ncbi:Haloacid dehalogenase [Tenacibaculum sp. 190130A14a]|uniref:Hydrolase of the HAD superfamily n=1 Tax=Tenacibaculum polynesiense TaxID=3137857 RepID=A0ABM9P8P9_9FLAO
MLSVKHIFFDLDHTLWDFDKNSKLTFKQIFEEQQIDLNIDVFLEVYMPINFEYWRLYREDKIEKEALRYGRLKDTFDQLKFSATDDLIHQISHDYISYLPNYNYLIDGTIELLEYLKPKYELHIITNGFEEVQNLKLEESGIKKYFNEIITSEEVGVKKPNVKVFEYAFERAACLAHESIMIGDSYEADVLGGINAGMLAVYFNPEKKEENGVLSIAKLSQLKQYL